MPELPDIEVYVDALRRFTVGHKLQRARVVSIFVLRSVDPPISTLEGKAVRSIRRIGKRIVLGFDDDLFLVVHLMIAGRFHWKKADAKVSPKLTLAAFDFGHGSVHLTEASGKKRASLHVVRGQDGLRAHDPAGLEPLACTAAEFRTALRRENHTLKRALTDPTIMSGIGNAYSDEILHRAKLSPFRQTQSATDDELGRLWSAMQTVLSQWTRRLRDEAGDGFPEKVTAFRPEMAVHGKFGQPCPVCGSPVQRIVYSENEANYCATCQTEGKLLADRALSRLLKADWPSTVEELERMKKGAA